MKVLITGVAGFIGFHLSQHLLRKNFDIIGIDNVNDYYDLNLKNNRLKILYQDNIYFKKINIADKTKIEELFNVERPSLVIHLAAQAGVRYSINNPNEYITSNIVGFQNIIESCCKFNVNHLMYASSSSVYGLNDKTPFSENDKTDNPANLYGATKKSNELVAFSYSNLYSLPTTGLRLFTVYGPWGRPDMAYFKFTKNVIEGKPISLYGNGNMYRDFTYIDDVVNAITKLMNIRPKKNNNQKMNQVPAEVYNIGNSNAVFLEDFVKIIEDVTGKKAIKNYLPMQMGDIYKTFADINKLHNLINFKPVTNINEGLPLFVDWYRSFYKYS